MGLTPGDRESALLARYRGRGVTRASELLLPREEALRFVDDCEREDLAILGMDFWAEKGGGLAQTGAADYSSLRGPDRVARSAAEARALLAGGVPDGGSHVSFVLD